MFYSIRSERQLREQVPYNLLYGWFSGLAMQEPVMGAHGVHAEPRALAGAGRSD